MVSKQVKATQNTNQLVNEYNALSLYNDNVTEIPKLLDPFFQTTGLASLVGESDGGKSTFLRQFALSIVLGLDKFIGHKLNAKHKKAIYVSTEDDSTSIRYSIRKQIDSLKKVHKITNLNPLSNLTFIFDTDKLLENLTQKLEKTPVDLIIIDAFSDVFNQELNANTQVRGFLNSFDQLAKKNECLILFLHHLTKSSSTKPPSKHNVIGSQGFEAKMRVVIELKPSKSNNEIVQLIVLKGNFLEPKYKNEREILNFNYDKGLTFKNTGRTFSPNQADSSKNISKSIPLSKNKDVIKRIKELKKEGLDFRSLASQMTSEGINISSSTANDIYNKNI